MWFVVDQLAAVLVDLPVGERAAAGPAAAADAVRTPRRPARRSPPAAAGRRRSDPRARRRRRRSASGAEAPWRCRAQRASEQRRADDGRAGALQEPAARVVVVSSSAICRDRLFDRVRERCTSHQFPPVSIPDLDDCASIQALAQAGSATRGTASSATSTRFRRSTTPAQSEAVARMPSSAAGTRPASGRAPT